MSEEKNSWFKDFFVDTVKVPVEKSASYAPSNGRSIAQILNGDSSTVSTPQAIPSPVTQNEPLKVDTENYEGKINSEFLTKILEKLKKEDLPGPDMLELYNVAQDMTSEGVALPEAIKMGYISLRAVSDKKITKQIIETSFAHYSSVIDRDKAEFESAFNNAMSSLVNEPKTKIKALQLENSFYWHQYFQHTDGMKEFTKNKCKKKRFDKIGAMLVVAKANSPAQKSFRRREQREYFCSECKSWHTTKRK